MSSVTYTETVRFVLYVESNGYTCTHGRSSLSEISHVLLRTLLSRAGAISFYCAYWFVPSAFKHIWSIPNFLAEVVVFVARYIWSFAFLPSNSHEYGWVKNRQTKKLNRTESVEKKLVKVELTKNDQNRAKAELNWNRTDSVSVYTLIEASWTEKISNHKKNYTFIIVCVDVIANTIINLISAYNDLVSGILCVIICWFQLWMSLFVLRIW